MSDGIINEIYVSERDLKTVKRYRHLMREIARLKDDRQDLLETALIYPHITKLQEILITKANEIHKLKEERDSIIYELGLRKFNEICERADWQRNLRLEQKHLSKK